MKGNKWIVKSISGSGFIQVYCEELEEFRDIAWEDVTPKRIAKKRRLLVNDTLIQRDNKYHLRNNRIYLGFVGVVVAVAMTGGVMTLLNRDDDSKINRYVEDTVVEDVNTDVSKTRFRFNTTVTVKKNTIQNLNFENVNEDKTMQIKIKCDDEYVFDSHSIEFGKKLTADVLMKPLDKGDYDALAEVYTFNSDGEKTNQTNFNMKIVVE